MSFPPLGDARVSYGEPIALRGQDLEQVASAPSDDVRSAVEEQFIERLRAGDAAAFDLLIEERSGEVYALLYRLTEDAEEARDLTQETFLRVFQSIKRFRGDAYVYFNNDTFGHAIHDAMDLSSLLESTDAVRHQGRSAAAALE